MSDIAYAWVAGARVFRSPQFRGCIAQPGLPRTPAPGHPGLLPKDAHSLNHATKQDPDRASVLGGQIARKDKRRTKRRQKDKGRFGFWACIRPPFPGSCASLAASTLQEGIWTGGQVSPYAILVATCGNSFPMGNELLISVRIG